MSRRMIVAVVLVAATLSGCAGIPTSGSPTSGDLIDDTIELEIGDAPQGPREGSTQQEILVEFISAATNPQGDYSVARQFLTSEFEREWNPDDIVRIAVATGATSLVGNNTMQYTFSTRASVTSDGRYLEQPEAETATLEFSFAQENGEWRISQAPPGVVLSEDRFDNVFVKQPIYFFDPTFAYLVPDVRWFPKQSGAASRVVEALLAGQADWLANGAVISAFPAGTALGPAQVTVESGIARVDLTDEVRSTNNTARDRMRQQLATSLAAVSGGLASVVITIDGTPLSLSQFPGAAAISDPQVDDSLLVYRDDEFGLVGAGNDITPIDALSTPIERLDPRAVTLARSQTLAGVLSSDGSVYVVDSGNEEPVLADPRIGLAAPSVDNSGFVWSVPRLNGAVIRATASDGSTFEVPSGLARGSRVVSMDVSRDGCRLLLYYSTPAGPRLAVAAIQRQDGAPTALSDLEQLPVSVDDPLDAAWVDSTTVATLARDGGMTEVTSVIVGGPSESVGELSGGASIVGGNDVVDLSVLTVGGEVLRPRATVWQRTDITASFMGTQQ